MLNRMRNYYLFQSHCNAVSESASYFYFGFLPKEGFRLPFLRIASEEEKTYFGREKKLPRKGKPGGNILVVTGRA